MPFPSPVKESEGTVVSNSWRPHGLQHASTCNLHLVVRIAGFHWCGSGSLPGQGTEMLHMARPKRLLAEIRSQDIWIYLVGFYLGQVLSTRQQLIPNTVSKLKSEMSPQLIWRWFNGTHKKHYWQQMLPQVSYIVLTEGLTPTLPPGAVSTTGQITICLHSFL